MLTWAVVSGLQLSHRAARISRKATIKRTFYDLEKSDEYDPLILIECATNTLKKVQYRLKSLGWQKAQMIDGSKI